MSRFARRTGGIETLARSSFDAIDRGAYEFVASGTHDTLSLKKALLSKSHARLITEIKFASPSRGKIRQDTVGPEQLARTMVQSGAAALSVLTQPNYFEGSLGILAGIRKVVSVPILMKDIIVSRVQIEAGIRAGADCVLLIRSVFDKNLAEDEFDTLYEFAKNKGLEVIVEVHSEDEYKETIGGSYPIVGINNRNLDDLTIDINTTVRLLENFGKGHSVIISESGVATGDHIRYLSKAGADAFLIGTSIMESENVGQKVREFWQAI